MVLTIDCSLLIDSDMLTLLVNILDTTKYRAFVSTMFNPSLTILRNTSNLLLNDCIDMLSFTILLNTPYLIFDSDRLICSVINLLHDLYNVNGIFIVLLIILRSDL